MAEQPEVKIDKRGRVLDRNTGQPLRNKDARNYKGAFKGEAGGEHPRAAKLKQRQDAYDAWAKSKANIRSRRRPGSTKK